MPLLPNAAAVQRARRNTLADLLHRTCQRHPDKLALVYDTQRLSYAQFDRLVNQTARALLEDGIEPGEMVAVLSKNSLDFAVIIFAVARIGAVLLPMNYMLTVSDLSYIVHHADIRVLVAAAEYTAAIDAAADAAHKQAI